MLLLYLVLLGACYVLRGVNGLLSVVCCSLRHAGCLMRFVRRALCLCVLVFVVRCLLFVVSRLLVVGCCAVCGVLCCVSHAVGHAVLCVAC